MPPKASAPKPAEFQVGYLEAGKKKWQAGGSGGYVALDGGFLGVSSRDMPKKEVLVVGKVLFGRQRFAFEVQELDNSPAAVRKLLQKQKDLEENRFGPSSFGLGYGGMEEPSQQPKKGGLDFFELCQARELAAKHSLQVKFQDIERIESAGDKITFFLSQALQCYVKPAGEPRIVNMEVVKDITGGARSITFQASGALPAQNSPDSSKTLSFAQVRQMVSDFSPRLEALFRGELPPSAPVATPLRKRSGEEVPGSSTKKPRVDASIFTSQILAADGSWLQKAIDRFQLKGKRNEEISDLQWQAYFKDRIILELREQATLPAEDEQEDTWPQGLGAKPEIQPLSFESYQEESEEQEMGSTILGQVRDSIAATVKSSSLKLDPEVFAKGVFLLAYHINDADEGEPRTVETVARIYAPNASGNFIDISYTNHHRARMSFTERFSHLHASKGGPGFEPPERAARTRKQREGEKIFDLDFDEHRRKNPTKTSLASNEALKNLGIHLFGAEGAMSNRKLFGLLVRAAGLGKFGENNGWPIAVARRRFKCGKDEVQTDTESIPGDNCEDAGPDGCCIM
mmetsp:Transcript_70854/g.125129  ORF Transcript_70854/g.125129 Transcript_70854/m.125129 type:complete len:571 (-) Transcript_70854:200-1912(-)|eukprot:CAMPEP_0197683904 /NCGR_PEP_ID=MMETSP1338-20131121/98664_1 /TAXON_ID=43686 ORGANISM="Pelagodinium beii, Strain RCC1491" /NCGR_SAMPLE_ID=MMETSP1338 /ASSEMBLY_ACC=CAM_ASM_000754 /LENGTH=570 /DNA_ID=CAMNT_0043265553 /DNA_START=37 /DNA_END=1749 /DNA_ORIENTATION=-